MKQWLSNLSLQTKLIALSLSIVFCLGLASTYFAITSSKLSKEEKEGVFLGAAYALSNGIAAQFYERYGDAQAFATNKGVRAQDRSQIVALLNKWAALYGIYDLILVVDRNGTLVAVNDKDPGGNPIQVERLYSQSFRKAPWFSDVMQGKFTEDPKRAFSGTHFDGLDIDPWISEVFGEKKVGSGFSAALKDDEGRVIGAISNRAGLRWLSVAFLETYRNLKNQNYGKHSVLELIRKDGTLLYRFDHDTEASWTSSYNFELGLKANFLENNHPIVKDLLEGKSGSTTVKIEQSGSSKMLGYTPVDTDKFISNYGWGVIVADDEAEAMEHITQSQNIFSVIFIVIFALSIIGSYFVSKRISQNLSQIAHKVVESSSKVSNESSEVHSISSQLSEAATEQAAALQETVASIDQVSAMVTKNADNAQRSMESSEQSRVTSTKGKEAVDQMVVAIEEINRSNTDIMAQIKSSNDQISEIVQVINEIGNKTKVINDIVFQTKLLSFNASVEAARAGEHGKGFAVVAEEVGNLARMSGQAAQEISGLLETSTEKVNRIVQETKTRVEGLIAIGKEKVDLGTRVAKQCGEALEGVLTSVVEVNEMIKEIATASKEQSQGVQEINKAMTQMDQVTQQNALSSQKSAGSAEKLSSESQNLSTIATNLLFTIEGHKTKLHSDYLSSDQHLKGEKSSHEKSSAQVIQLKRTNSKADFKNEKTESHKKVANGSSLPARDDSRFEDI